MKLKKIASLMLAGVMAVSMLAGCSTGNNNNNTDTEVVTSSMASAANDGQDAGNAAAVKFTASSNLTKALNQMVTTYGEEADVENDFEAFFTKVTGVSYTGTFNDDSTSTTPSHDGEKITDLFTVKIESSNAANEAAAMKLAAAEVNTEVAKLKATTFKEGTTKDKEKYNDYSYTGEISDMVAVKALDGSVTYYAVYTITQTTAEKTFERA